MKISQSEIQNQCGFYNSSEYCDSQDHEKKIAEHKKRHDVSFALSSLSGGKINIRLYHYKPTELVNYSSLSIWWTSVSDYIPEQVINRLTEESIKVVMEKAHPTMLITNCRSDCPLVRFKKNK